MVLMVFFQLEDFAFTSTVILRERSPARHGGRHFRDVADLRGEVCPHGVDGVGQVFQVPADAGHVWPGRRAGLRCRPRAHARHFGRAKRLSWSHHGIERFLQLKDFPRHVDGDLAGEVAARMAVATSAMLRTWAVRLPAMELTESGGLPGAGHAGHLGLAAELPSYRFARHARHFAGKRIELVDHGVERFLS